MGSLWILSIEFQLNWYINQKKLDFEIIYFELYSATFMQTFLTFFCSSILYNMASWSQSISPYSHIHLFVVTVMIGYMRLFTKNNVTLSWHVKGKKEKRKTS